MKLIVFDIGSNSVRTGRYTARADEPPLLLSTKHVYTTRLAEGLAETGLLSEARMQQSLLVIRSVFTEAVDDGFVAYAYATSAVRDAKNGHSFVREVEAILGNGHARVLSGAEEAAFAQLGADPQRSRTLIDIGGGSTQIIRGAQRESWPIGCVRAKDLAPGDDLARVDETLRPILADFFGAAESGAPSFADPETPASIPIGVGGTITTLALLCDGQDRFSRWEGEKQIEYFGLSAVLGALGAMGDAARANVPLLKNRHDVILHGGLILQFLMERLQTQRIGATLRDGLDGYAQHLFETLHDFDG